ncbi:DUF5677 domain-containing protein [Bacillus thuringiensis]|jgi:hypothetical protein|uniref:DUF5677 domain-containing protein n=1 Tax=Bacillus thuringiensis TaxID=1428 RepID=UPI0015801E4A|nr:DUF5677 domain-containing protein [Bacillus thuringiensis]NUH91279.1 hypothetical protein [Bacillus thuringiensis]NUH96693.1 hypothetical protein [Bacillus thuringiensis]NUI02001.1 hypothetical protein [Bacillus thuringiensis]NUI07223.1 hypothetical protein [Bacillus thuringiensis]NUI15232.1 hypothetical protein [Bacillus thuringiensis]
MNKNLEILSRCIQFGEGILIELERKNNFDLEHKIVISLYRKLIEQADASYVLADHDLGGPLTVVKRSIFETYLALRYILQEEELIPFRAYSYYIGFFKDREDNGKEWLSQDKVDMSNSNLEEELTSISKLLEHPKLISTIQNWENTKRKSKRKYNPKWYSLSGGPANLKELSDLLMENEPLVYNMYGSFSQEAHGYTALEASNNLDLIDSPLLLKPIRSKIDPTDISVARSLFTGAMFEVINYLLPERLDDCRKFADTIGMKAEIHK